MNIFRRNKAWLYEFMRNCWRDPVWSKVISAGIISLVIVLSQLQFQTKIAILGVLALVCLSVISVMMIKRRKRLAQPKNLIPVQPELKPANLVTPTIFLERFGLKEYETNFLDVFGTDKYPPMQINKDGFYGRVMEFCQKDDIKMEYLVKPGTRGATTISYTFTPLDRVLLILKVKVESENNDAVQNVEIALRPHHSVFSLTDVENNYTINYTTQKGDWVNSVVSLPEVVKITLGSNGWHYHSILGFKLLGCGKIADVTLS